MFSGYFNSGLRGNLTRDDTCTVLAEYGNEYADNGYERYVEEQKRKMRRELDEHPVWKGAYGSSSLALGKKVKKEEDPFYQPTPPRPKPRDVKVQEAAENIVKAKAIRELFEKQRDREAHDRDLEHLDPQGIEVLPDGTKVRRRPLGAAAALKKKKSQIFDKNFLRATGGIAPTLGTGALSSFDEQVLAEYLAPPTQYNDEDDYFSHKDRRTSASRHPANFGGLRRTDSLASELHSMENRKKFVASLEDDAGCPIDASIGTIGLFRQIRRWKKFVPKDNNFSSNSFNWPLRLDLPLQDDARSFETLMRTQMDAQWKAMNDEEDRIRSLSARSTPAFFDGDGTGAQVCQYADYNVELPRLEEMDEFSNSPRVRRDKQTEAFKRRFFYDESESRGSNSASGQRHQHHRSLLLDDSPMKPQNVASPMISFAHGAGGTANRSGINVSSSPRQQQQQQHRRPISATTNSANQIYRASIVPTNELLTVSTSRRRPTSARTLEQHDEAQKQQQIPRPPATAGNRVLRKQPPTFKAISLDPRFVKSSIQTVGQRMLMVNTEELECMSPRRS
jgi:hypothetical protein